jgi:hypothetical protein
VLSEVKVELIFNIYNKKVIKYTETFTQIAKITYFPQGLTKYVANNHAEGHMYISKLVTCHLIDRPDT